MSSLSISSKLPSVGTSIFTVMSALATEYKAVNLGQGFPDFDMSHELTALVTDAMNKGMNQYAPMQGYMPLREVLAAKVASLYGTQINPDTQITITPGGTYAIYTALSSILQPGDEVIVFEPAYDSYIPNITVNGAVPVLIHLQFPDYKINWELVKEKITAKTRVIMLNSPHNPTGSVLREEDMQALREIVKDSRIIIQSDEVYEHLIYDGIAHQSILRYPDLLERSFVSFSFGKVFHCTGWKLGYSIASPALMAEFRKLHQFNCFSCHTPSQVALATYLKNPSSYLSLGSFLQEKRDYFQSLMQQTRFTAMPSYGSYFQCYQYNRISDESDKELCTRLTKEYGVAAIPVSAFYQSGTDNKVIRFCFAKKKDTIDAAVERLRKVQ
ncbi:MAG TPA: methionine aminotransferase [Chitinophagaceae bacterium]|nr:methionine aminotransferase [Chitinophagaceae bacterium]